MGRLISSLLILGLIVSGCAPRGNNTPSSVRDTAPMPEQPQVRQAGNYEVIEGATQLQGMDVAFDKGTSKITLQGKMILKTLDSKKTLPIDVQLQGTTDVKGYAVMKPVGSVGIADMQIGAKATCLGVEADCSSNFIDIYISYEDRIYHHQVESVEDTMDMGQEPKKAQPQVTPSPGQSAAEEDDSFADEDGDDGHDEMDVADEQGQYVGDVGNDIDKVLVNPKPKTPAPKPSPSASPKADEPKKETPKQDPPKKDTPKQDPPKKEDPKKDTPKKDDPKKDAPKADDKGKDKDDGKKDDDKDIPVVVNPPKFDLLAKLDQAVGSVNSGTLDRATDILSYQKAYPETNLSILKPDRLTHFGTIEMAYLVAKMGKYTKAIAPAHVLRMGDVSRKNGGRLGSHKSHTNGLDADIAYYFKADKAMTSFASALKGGKPIGDWMMAQQWKLFKYAVSSKFVDRIFIHPTLKKSLCTYAQNQGEMDTDLAKDTLRRLVPEVNHYNHFHIRIKCSESQERCKQMADPKPGTGC
jgi:penicillin-insensitive murein endopeptidase